MTNDRAQLEALAPLELLPWLTLEEALRSIRRLGALTGRTGPAEGLAARMDVTLSARPPPNAPRVLLVIYGGPKLDEVLFVRDNSLHGAALSAAGAQNAVAPAVQGVPRMSLEDLIRLDPPTVVVLAEPRAGSQSAILEPWRHLTPLQAVRAGRIAAILERDVYSTGPSILRLVARLRSTLEEVGVLGEPSPPDGGARAPMSRNVRPASAGLPVQ